MVVVLERGVAIRGTLVRTADEADPGHIAAPMPGLISLLSIKVGDPVKAGDRLMSIEAMKMESGIFASRDGIVAELLAKTGDVVDAKQLLCVIHD